MVLLLAILAGALWVLIPAYVANALATLPGGRGPSMDLGRSWPRDGRRVLGASKTWSGFLAGVLGGMLVGLIPSELILIAPPSLQIVPRFGTSLMGSLFPLFLLSAGAMSGDALGSFLKRRWNYASSAPAPLLDQWPFLLVPMALLGFADPSLFLSAFWPGPLGGLLVLAWVLLLTLFLHTAFNWVGYFIGTKKVPW